MGNISKTKVGLRIFGDELVPEEVTNLLMCQPTKSVKRNDVVGTSDKPRLAKTGSWHLDVEIDDNSLLEQKVEKLLSQITDDFQVWKQITAKFKVDIFCGLFLENFNEGFGLSPDLMKKLSDRNLEIGFDIYLP